MIQLAIETEIMRWLGHESDLLSETQKFTIKFQKNLSFSLKERN